jgi:hypothetical protein
MNLVPEGFNKEREIRDEMKKSKKPTKTGFAAGTHGINLQQP